MRALELLTRTLGVCPKHGCGKVQTSNGLLIGHEAPNASHVTEYLGIPYAQPPLGHLRFAAPVKFDGDKKSTYEASEYVGIPTCLFRRCCWLTS